MNSTQKYSEIDKSSMSQVELEVRALVKSASNLNAIKENWEAQKKDLDEALNKNRRLWTIFASEMNNESCPQPLSVRSGIINLANYIFKKTVDIMVSPAPEKLTSLIDINMNIARGLSEKKTAPQEEAAPVVTQAETPSEEVKKQDENDKYGDIFGE
ncbi:MAG: flagellar biosynthesis regulator FlaF [Alphaproteobacteria bacterium]|nr:flagellar biosynthesis regulator FlaF [Alphaproteobacteria bacterium]